MKGIMILTLICICGFSGFLYANALQKRLRDLEAFIFGLELLETEMVYAKNPLWLCFLNAGKGMDGYAAAFFSSLGQGLKERRFDTGEQGFLALLEKNKVHFSLEEKEYDILRYFAANLGVTDQGRQQEKIRSAKCALENALKRGREQEKKWGRVSGIGGWLIGIVVGLLLI